MLCARNRALPEKVHCFLVGVIHMERKYYEAYDDRYCQVHQEKLRWFSDTPSHIVGDVMKAYGIDGKLLEIGCGEGRDAHVLLERGYDLLATDVSREAIAFCRSRWEEYAENFRVLDAVNGELNEKFDFIYAVAVLHMLVQDEDRNGFYRFIKAHLKDWGYALICSMGDGVMERSSDISTAFDLQERIHEDSGKKLCIAGTSYRAVSFESFEAEIRKNGLQIVERGLTDVAPDYWSMMYAVVKKNGSY